MYLPMPLWAEERITGMTETQPADPAQSNVRFCADCKEPIKPERVLSLEDHRGDVSNFDSYRCLILWAAERIERFQKLRAQYGAHVATKHV